MTTATVPRPKTLPELERDHGRRLVEEALRRARGSVVGAARILGVSRVTVWRRMRRYGISAAVVEVMVKDDQ